VNLQKLVVRRMPGFVDVGFTLDGLSGGLNVVVGPNASGKTTACQAIRGALWPSTLRGASPVSVVTEWDDDGQLVRLELEGEGRTCQRDGVVTDPPTVPGAHLAQCFTTTVDDLFAGTDAELAASVAREMAGGYDLNAVRQDDRFKLSRARGRRERDAVQKARHQVRAVETEQDSLLTEQRRLGQLEEEKERALSARTRLPGLADAGTLVSIRAEIDEVRRQLAAFPAGIEELLGNETTALAEIVSDLCAAAGDLDGANSKARDARRRMAEAGLPEAGIPAAHLERQDARLEQLRTLEGAIREKEERAREADTRVQEAAGALGCVRPAEEPDRLDVTGLDELEGFHRDVESVTSTRSALSARLSTLGNEEPVPDLDATATGIGILREWFEAPLPEAPGQIRNVLLLLLLSFLLAGVAIVLAATLSPWWALLLLPSAGGAFAAWRSRTQGTPDLRGACQERYERLPLAAPPTWERGEVGKHLTRLEQTLAKGRQEQEREVERRACRGQLDDMEKQTQDMEARRVELVGRLGLAPGVSNLALVVLGTDLLRYQEARAGRSSLVAELDRLRGEHRECLGSVNGFLSEHGEIPSTSYDGARVRSRAVAARAMGHREATKQLEAAHKGALSAEKRLSDLEERRRLLFAGVGLEPGDEHELHRRLELRPEYLDVRKRLADLEVKADVLADRLAGDPDLLGLTSEQIEEETTRLGAVAKRYEELVDEIADIRQRVERAGRETHLEEAVAQVDRVTELLAEQRRDACLAAAGRFLLDEVETAHMAESQPQVFRESARWFSLFTRGRYELRIAANAAEPSEFRALDSTTNRGHALDELSRGTRMQLLLAVRVAFAMAAEEGTVLPLVLDEVLNTSDPVRFRAVAECLLALVSKGRQVFYFTCQPSNAAAWEEVADEMGVVGAQAKQLGRFFVDQGEAPALLTASAVQTERVPEPGGASLDEYASSIGVPPLGAGARAAATHVAHLVDDASQLHRLVSAGIQTYGQLASLADRSDVSSYIDESNLDRVRARACLVDAFADAWQIGRGSPVSREALLEAGVSGVFIDRVTDLARDSGWDARRLIDALQRREDERAKGFRSNVLGELIENLETSGYLDARPRLGREDLLTPVLASASEHVASGVITGEEARALFDQLWSMGGDAQGA